MNRVRVRDYGVLPGGSKLLVEIPSVGVPQRLHWCAAEAFRDLAGAVKAALKIDLQAASAWRPHRWASRRDYEAYLLRNYKSMAEGRKWIAFDSPHETGLAVDLGVGGLWPTRKTIDQQRERPLYKWLVRHAAKYGMVPYTAEPWHWEFPIDPAKYRAEAGADLSAVDPQQTDAANSTDATDATDVDICEADDICEDLETPA